MVRKCTSRIELIRGLSFFGHVNGFWPEDDGELNTSDSDVYEAASASRSKKVSAFSTSDLFRKQLCLSGVASAPRWLLARTF